MNSISTELDLFCFYVDAKLSDEKDRVVVNEAVQRFREYQSQLATARDKVAAAIESSDRGESRVLSEQDVEARLHRLAAQHYSGSGSSDG